MVFLAFRPLAENMPKGMFSGRCGPRQGGEHPQAQSSQDRRRPALLPSGSAGFGRQLKNCAPSVSLRSTLQADKSSFRLISPPMRFPPQAVIGGSSLDPQLRMLYHFASKRLNVTIPASTPSVIPSGVERERNEAEGSESDVQTQAPYLPAFRSLHSASPPAPLRSG